MFGQRLDVRFVLHLKKKKKKKKRTGPMQTGQPIQPMAAQAWAAATKFRGAALPTAGSQWPTLPTANCIRHGRGLAVLQCGGGLAVLPSAAGSNS